MREAMRVLVTVARPMLETVEVIRLYIAWLLSRRHVRRIGADRRLQLRGRLLLATRWRHLLLLLSEVKVEGALVSLTIRDQLIMTTVLSSRCHRMLMQSVGSYLRVNLADQLCLLLRLWRILTVLLEAAEVA